jgi:outer membrane protein insertion porin family
VQKTILIFCVFIIFTSIYAQEDKKFELSDIEFEGNQVIPSSELKDIIISGESPGWFSQFLYSFSNFGGEAVYFDSLLIPSDLQSLQSYYWSKGFFKVKVNSKYNIDTSSNDAELIYHIKEGPPFTFRDFNKNGLWGNVPDDFVEEMNDEYQIDSTIRYSESLVQQELQYTISYLRDKGYMLANTETPQISVDTVQNRVDVDVDVNPGKRYKISEVRISKTGVGKDLVNSQLLRDIVGIEPGSYYNFYELQRGQVRLYRTNLFTTALVTAIIADTTNNKVPINISVDVGLMHDLSPEIIVNDEDNAFNLGLGLGFTKKNFFGDARKLTLSTSAAAQSITEFLSHPSVSDTTIFGYADARVILDQPFLFGEPINTKLETYLTLQKRKNEYNATLFGAKLTFDFEVPKYVYFTSLQTYFNWENAKFVYRNQYISQATINSDSVFTNTSTSTNTLIGVEVGANKTNDPLFPTRGYSLSLLMEEGNALAYLANKIDNRNFDNPLYYKVLVTTSYFPAFYASKTSAFGMKFKLGYIQSYSGNKFDIPLNQRFHSGGSNSIRGWKTRELQADNGDISLPENPTIDEIETIFFRNLTPGGFFLLEGSFETRNRLIGNLGSAVFIDYGDTWNDYKNFRWDQIAVAAGFGLRYYTDFAPIRIDFGFKVYDPFDKRSFFKKKFFNTFEFHLGIGEAF